MKNPDPKLAEHFLQKRVYESALYYRSSFSFIYSTAQRYKSIQERLIKELKNQKNAPDIKILDIGCNEGSFIFSCIEKLKSYQPQFFGIDISGMSVEMAKFKKDELGIENCSFYQMDAVKLNFKDKMFDIIVCSEVIEHIPDPGLLIKEIKRVLKNSGKVIITTPNSTENKPGKQISQALGRKLLKALQAADKNYQETLDEKSKQSIDKYMGPEHVSMFSHQKLVSLVKGSGFGLSYLSGTGGLVLGHPFWDNHRFVFALTILADSILSAVALSHLWSETLLIELTAPNDPR